MREIEIKGDKKSYLIALLLFILLGMVAMWGYDHYQLKKELAEEVENSAGKNIIIERWKDEYNREHVVAQSRQITIKELKNSQDSFIVAIRKEVGNIKNFVSRTSIQASTGGQVRTGTKDTLIIVNDKPQPAKTFNYVDKWLTLRGYTLQDSAIIKYDVKNTFTEDHKWVRPKWYKQKELTLELRSENPNTTVNKVQTYTLKQPVLKWYETKVFVAGASFAGGFLIGKALK